VPRLDGTWAVERTGGALPPLLGVRKEISGRRGRTRLGPLPGVPFVVEGLALRYRRPFAAFVDYLEPDGERYAGTATFAGRKLGTFRMSRIRSRRSA
jgi:hypothetical protein